MRFKNLEGNSKGKAQKGQYLLAVGLVYYKWYQSQTLGDVPARTLGLEGGGLGSPTLIVEGNECQRECWASKGDGL